MVNQEIAALNRPKGMPFQINKVGHIALYVRDLERSARFYTQVLGFRVSDVYGEDMVPGGAVFLRCNADHHGVALFRANDVEPENAGLHHLAFEVGMLEEVFRAREHLRRHDVPIDFEGRRRAGCQVAVEFRDPDGHRLEIYWNIDQIGTNEKARPAEEWKGANSLEAAVADPVVGQDTTLVYNATR